MSPPAPAPVAGKAARKVVYMPTCVTRMMGPSRSDTERSSVHQKMLSLFAKGGYEVVYPEVCPLGPPADWAASAGAAFCRLPAAPALT